MFVVESTYKNKNEFNIYNHTLSFEELNNNIIEMLFTKKALNYIFNGTEEIEGNYIKMLQRFIPEEFINCEQSSLNLWNKSKQTIKERMSNNKSFYSFYAEALMAYLNYKYIDNYLISGVININETLNDQKSGADNCMISKTNIILGEAKFYKNFNLAKKQIISDFENKSLLNKLQSLYRSYNESEVLVKKITGEYESITFNEFLNLKIMLSGFILHNNQKEYIYNDIDEINISLNLTNVFITFYHLPIKSKEELIYLIIKRALELIINEPK